MAPRETPDKTSTPRDGVTLMDSGRAERRRFDADRLLPVWTLLLVLWVVCGVEWLWSLGPREVNPVYTTVIAALMSVYAVGRTWPELRKLRYGAWREATVGEELEKLRRLGYRVRHRVPLDGADLHHVVVSTHGVFAIEVARRSRPPRLERRIHYDGSAVSVNGGPPDDSVVLRPLAQARQLRRLLKERTDTVFPVRAVLLYPGWDVESLNARERADAWVLSPRALPMWIRHEPESVSPKDVRAAAAALDGWLERFR